MSDITFKDVSLTKRAPAWKLLHSNEEEKPSQMTLVSFEAKNNLYLLTHKTNLINRQNKHTT